MGLGQGIPERTELAQIRPVDVLRVMDANVGSRGEGERYASKAVFGVAARYALGKELKPVHFSGGEDSTCFKVLRREGFEVVRKRRAFLLTWNPEQYTLEQFRDYLSRLNRNNGQMQWSTGPRKDIPSGSLLFLMRLGQEPKGIVGVGESTGPVKAVPHWDKARAWKGDTSNSVQWRIDRLQETPIIDLKDLASRWGQMEWTPQSSGVEIKLPEAIDFLADAASSTVGGPRMAEEVDGGETHTEGAVATVTVNAYERDPKARRKCLAYHGARCQACEKTMAEIYGPVGEGMIHVHHRKPLYTIGKTYQVDPIHDLVPVCPNCHAILHRSEAVMTVEQLRNILAGR